MADSSEINASEFTVLRRLLADEAADVEADVVQGLVAKRFARRSEKGWVVTVQGHAAFLHELRESFDRPPSEG